MTIAFDASSSNNATVAQGATLTVAHTPSGTPRGVFLGVITASGDITSEAVTYGGVAVPLVAGPIADAAGETVRVWAHFLGTGIPTGAQDAIWDREPTDPDSRLIGMIVVTVTAGADTQLAGTTGFATTSGDAVDPSVTVTGIGGASYSFGVLGSGADTVGAVTAGSLMTMRPQIDFGSFVGSVESSTAQLASGDSTITFIQTLEDVAMIGVAIQEAAAGGTTVVDPFGMSGFFGS